MNALSFLELPAPVYADYVLEAKLAWRRQGLRTALLTVVSMDGASPRPLGSQLAVAEDGQSVGAITGGCAEPAMVRDALKAMAKDRNHIELYGKGSRYKDITLPCGSGIEVYFDVSLATPTLEKFVAAHARREVTHYSCDAVFEKTYLPKRRVVIAGRGHIVPALAQTAKLSECDTVVYCPDIATRQQCAPFARVEPLVSTDGLAPSLFDPWTAFVSLFHEHDFEPDILNSVLRSPAFYIGALGSRRTHTKRLDVLQGSGWTPETLDRIRGPVGLNIGAKTPPEIAVSIIGDIIGTWRTTYSAV